MEVASPGWEEERRHSGSIPQPCRVIITRQYYKSIVNIKKASLKPCPDTTLSSPTRSSRLLKKGVIRHSERSEESLCGRKVKKKERFLTSRTPFGMTKLDFQQPARDRPARFGSRFPGPRGLLFGVSRRGSFVMEAQNGQAYRLIRWSVRNRRPHRHIRETSRGGF